MNEAETRAEHIDPALKAAGWGVVEGSRVRREYPIAPGRIEGPGKRGKPLTADYVLEYRNTKLAVMPCFRGPPQNRSGAFQRGIRAVSQGLALTPGQRLLRSWRLRRRLEDPEGAHDARSLPRL